MVNDFLMKSWHYFLYNKILSLLLAGLVVGAVGYSSYSYLSTSREKYAYKNFAESHDLFEQAVAADDGTSEKKNTELWKDVELAFEEGYLKNKKSSIAPYFLAFQAEALIQQKELAKAVTVMDGMMASLKKDSPLFGLYAVKSSLMKLDMENAELRKRGLEELIKLANEELNPSRDMALYYLGEYYWSQNEPQKARISWQYLQDVAQFGKSPTPSPWFELVKSRIEIA
jgi:cytochrome c-type biogenesis protein CcmH/NrfG